MNEILFAKITQNSISVLCKNCETDKATAAETKVFEMIR